MSSELMQSLTIKQNFFNHEKIEITNSSPNRQGTTIKTTSGSTIKQVLQFFLGDNINNILIYFNKKLIKNLDRTIKDVFSEMNTKKVQCEIKPSKKCIFITNKEPSGINISFDPNNDNFLDLLHINPNQDFYFIFTSNKEEIKKDDFIKNIVDNQKYYIVSYPLALHKKLDNIIYKELIINSKSDFSFKDIQHLSCIISILDKNDQIKKQILQKLCDNQFVPLAYSAEKLLHSKETIVCNQYFLCFIYSLLALKTSSDISFLDIFSELYNAQKSPFEVFYSKNIFNIKDEIYIIYTNGKYGICEGVCDSNQTRFNFYDPIECKTDQIGIQKYQELKLNFEDIFFDCNDFFFTGKKIGEGSFGEVYLAKRNSDNKLYAAKIIKSYSKFNQKEQLNLMRESMILHKLKHETIMNFNGINFQSIKNPLQLEPTIITELISNGSLEKIIYETRVIPQWTPTKKYIFLIGIACGMNYLHQNQVAHRDLKPANILIDENFYPKICDLGLSRCFPETFDKSIELSISGCFGTCRYMAPELINDENEKYDPKKIDVYSFSIVAYEILTGRKFICGNNEGQIILNVLKGIRPPINDNITEKMFNLLSLCWDENPKKRPNFSEIYYHLTSDYSSYMNEPLDTDEIDNYRSHINGDPKTSNHFVLGNIYIDEKELNDLFFENKDYIKTNVNHPELSPKNTISESPYDKIFIVQNQNDQKEYTMRTIKTDIFKRYQQMILLRESLIQHKLQHRSILKFIGLNFQSFENNSKIKPSILTEFCPNYSLNKFMKENKNLTMTQKAILILGIADGMRYIHGLNIIHGHLSPKCILIDENFHPKIMFPPYFSENYAEQMEISAYLDPELFYIQDESKITPQSDVYSFAIIMNEILTEKSPYYEWKSNDICSMRLRIMNGKRPLMSDNVNAKMKSLISSCWKSFDEEQPSFDEIFNYLFDDLSSYFGDEIEVDIVKSYFDESK